MRTKKAFFFVEQEKFIKKTSELPNDSDKNFVFYEISLIFNLKNPRRRQ